MQSLCSGKLWFVVTLNQVLFGTLSAAMWSYGDRFCLPLSNLPTDRVKDTDHMDQLIVFGY